VVPLVKQPLTSDERRRCVVPDARPVIPQEVDFRAIGTTVADASAEALSFHLAPQQLGVAVSGGIEVMVHGFRILLELHRDFVVIKIDLRNGYNAISRVAILRRLSAIPRLAFLVPFLHALLAAPTDIYGDGGRERLFDDVVRRALGDAMEGMWQGFGLSSGGFAVGIHPELRQLDRELRWFGGMARAIMDDVVAAGPAHVVFLAVTRFIARVHEFTDLVGQTSKFVCTRMDDPASLA